MRILLSLVVVAALAAEALAQGMATLRPGDVFEMRLGGMSAEFAQEFNTTYTIGQEGRVNFPHIGEIQAVGLTPLQLQTSIQNKLIAEKIFTRPSVNINVGQTLRTVTIGGGGVRQANKIQWSPDLTLSSAIDQAGGLNEWGSKRGVRLIRDGKVQVFDMRKFDKDPSLDPKLLPGDQVTVPGG